MEKCQNNYLISYFFSTRIYCSYANKLDFIRTTTNPAKSRAFDACTHKADPSKIILAVSSKSNYDPTDRILAT